jgi:glycosyltransferase involved in cell wall biosynthesis
VSADRVDLFVADSHHVRERIEKHYRRSALVLHPPVDASFFTPADPPSPASADAPLLVVSALVPYKGVERTIRVANRLGLPLRVVGTGPEEKRLRRLAGPTVRFDSWLSMDALRDAYRSCRALIQAHEEDFGIAPLEAMACGRPAVALRRGGAAEVVAPGTGVLFDEETDDGLEQALAELKRLRFDPATLRRHALTFDRATFKARMETLIDASLRAFQSRRERPEPWRRMEGLIESERVEY